MSEAKDQQCEGLDSSRCYASVEEMLDDIAPEFADEFRSFQRYKARRSFIVRLFACGAALATVVWSSLSLRDDTQGRVCFVVFLAMLAVAGWFTSRRHLHA